MTNMTKECETDPDQTVGSEEGCWNSVLDPAFVRSMMEHCPKALHAMT